jgi:NADH:ubiquinone oxidoreductase subunit H
MPYWAQSLFRVLGGIVAVLLPAGTIVYVFLFKMMSFMQSRLGPMEAGPYGSMQLFAEVGKWLQKEDLYPERADKFIFKIAPLVVLTSTFLLVAVVPFGPDAWFTDFEAGVFYALAVSSVSVLCILIAGWASANKYSLLGGLRAAGQLIAYELPMVLAVIGVVILAMITNILTISNVSPYWQGAVKGAVIVLAAVFCVLGVLPLIALTQLGIIVGLGILLDTFVVRTVVVPALFTLIGPRIWWPAFHADDIERTGEIPTATGGPDTHHGDSRTPRTEPAAAHSPPAPRTGMKG